MGGGALGIGKRTPGDILCHLLIKCSQGQPLHRAGTRTPGSRTSCVATLPRQACSFPTAVFPKRLETIPFWRLEVKNQGGIRTELLPAAWEESVALPLAASRGCPHSLACGPFHTSLPSLTPNITSPATASDPLRPLIRTHVITLGHSVNQELSPCLNVLNCNVSPLYFFST